MIDGRQLTVVFHVDDIKASLVSESDLKDLLQLLQSEFGEEQKLQKLEGDFGDVHDYLGLRIDYSFPGKVCFTMFNYLEDIIVEASDDLKPKNCKYPSNDKLFHVDEDSPLLDAKKADLFHRLVARILYASHRARPDVAVTTAFLCSRVKSPTEEDYNKLGRLIGYLRDTINLPLVLGGDGRDTLTWNIDASYAVHPDCKSHTGAAVTLGHGTFMPMSSKQKLVSRSSTEAELIGVADTLSFIIWAKQFFEAQMEKVPNDSKLKALGKDVVYEQDNTSAILLQRNGKRSSTRRTKHINCRYFYITDRINNGDVTVVHKPTEEMWSDFHTKGLTGKLFLKHRETLMGLAHHDGLKLYQKYKAGQKQPPS